MASTSLAYTGERRDDREDVHHRTTATTATGQTLSMVVVNISPNGLMARCEQVVAAGTPLTFRLPGLAPVTAEVRWTLGGRIGCEFTATIPVSSYFATIQRLRT